MTETDNPNVLGTIALEFARYEETPALLVHDLLSQLAHLAATAQVYELEGIRLTVTPL